jgi:hypothetical protein
LTAWPSRALGLVIVVVAMALAAVIYQGWTVRPCVERRTVVCMSFDCPDSCARYSTRRRSQAAAPVAGSIVVVGVATGAVLFRRSRMIHHD